MKKYKLGKLAAKHDPRTLRLANYLIPYNLPPIPETVDWTGGRTDWGMMLNDTLGDCAIAGPAHQIMAWTQDESGIAHVVPDVTVEQTYSAISGYIPGNPDSDNGCVLLDVLNHWKNVGISTDQIAAYASFNPRFPEHAKQAINLFGGAIVGLQLPDSAEPQFEANQPWSLVPGSQIEGGHCVYVVGYDADGLICITWRRCQKMTWDFFMMNCDEAYATVSCDWAMAGKSSPSGVALGDLIADAKVISL